MRPAAPHPPTLSIGIAELGMGEEFPSLYARVDAALYQAKHAGKNRAVAHAGPA